MSILMDEALFEAVIEQIEADLSSGDLTALAELLSYIPKNCLIGFLPEERWGDFNA
jgi:hypothetical protein